MRTSDFFNCRYESGTTGSSPPQTAFPEAAGKEENPREPVLSASGSPLGSPAGDHPLAGTSPPVPANSPPSLEWRGKEGLQVSDDGSYRLSSKADTKLPLSYTRSCPWYSTSPGLDPESAILQLPWPPSGTFSLHPLPDCLTAPSFGRALPGYNRPMAQDTHIAAIF